MSNNTNFSTLSFIYNFLGHITVHTVQYALMGGQELACLNDCEEHELCCVFDCVTKLKLNGRTTVEEK